MTQYFIIASKNCDEIFGDLISKVAQPFADPKFTQYHNMLQLGESIKSLKAGKPVNFKELVRKKASMIGITFKQDHMNYFNIFI